MPKLIVNGKKGQRRLYFFFLFFLLSPKLSVVSFFFFDSFLSFFGEENDAVRCKCLACGRFFSPSQIAVVVVVDVSIDWKEVERICRPLFCPSISARLYLLSLYSKNLLLLLGYNRETWRQPQTSHSAVCVWMSPGVDWFRRVCTFQKASLLFLFFPSSTRLSLYRMVYI